MTKRERKYLRAAYHHFDKKTIRHTKTPDTKELAQEWRNHQALLKIIFNVLSLEGDHTGECLEDLNELVTEQGIELT